MISRIFHPCRRPYPCGRGERSTLLFFCPIASALAEAQKKTLWVHSVSRYVPDRTWQWRWIWKRGKCGWGEPGKLALNKT